MMLDNAGRGGTLDKWAGKSTVFPVVFGDIIEGNYTTFDENGHLTMIGDATVFEDDNVNLLSIKPGVSSPSYGVYNNTGLYITYFNASQLQEVIGGREIPHKFKTGGRLIPHLHWCPTTNASGNVKFGLEYMIIEDNTVYIYNTIYSIQASNGIAWSEIRMDFPEITDSRIRLGQQSAFRLFRMPTDPQDTYPDSVGAFTYGLHYEIDSLGSNTILTK